MEREGLFGRARRGSEWLLVPGEHVFVLGTAAAAAGSPPSPASARPTPARAQQAPGPDARSALNDRLRALKRDAAALARFDVDAGGRLGALPARWILPWS